MNSQNLNASKFCKVNFMIGKSFSESVQKLKSFKKIELIGSHGQTIWHQVNENGHVDSTFQLGESSIIALETKIPTVHDFRTSDVAVGGAGAPLTSTFDYLILRHETKWRAVQNIGGIGNVTILPPLNCDDQTFLLSFDTGPGNVILDEIMRIISDGELDYDEDGKYSSEGKVNEDLLKELLSMEYFSLKPPKTTGRELFGYEFTKKLYIKCKDKGIENNEILSTILQFTVESIVNSYKTFGPKELISQVIIGGGGIHNKEMMKRLKLSLQKNLNSNIEFLGHHELEEMNFDPRSNDAKESILFAFLAYLNYKKRFSNIPKVTGAKKKVILGKLTLPNQEETNQ